MSSEIETVGALAVGLTKLAGEAAVSTIVTANQIRKNAEKRAEEKGNEIRRIMEMEENIRENILLQQCYKEFIADIEDLLDNAKITGMKKDFIKKIEDLRDSAKKTESELNLTDNIDISRYYTSLNEFLKIREPIATVMSEEIHKNRQEFFERISMLENALSSMNIKYQENSVVYITTEQREREKLNKEFRQTVNDIRNILMIEQKRSQMIPISKESISVLKSLFDGIDIIIQEIQNRKMSNIDFDEGIQFLKKRLDEYIYMMEILNLEEAEFMEYYENYRNIMSELGQEYYESIEFSDIDELKEHLKYAKEKIELAKQRAQILKILGKEAYICYAYDEELKALGYEVMSDDERIKVIKKELGVHVSNGYEIPAYNAPDSKSAMQIYDLDENCELEVIIHPDGSTTMSTYMKGDEPDDTIISQKKHCRKSKLLAKRLRENWFILSDAREVESASQVKRVSLGTKQGVEIRKNERVKEENQKTMSK